MLGLMLVSGFFSASETAFFYLSHDELRSFRVGKPRERLVAELLLDADRLLTAVLFWNLLINLTYFAVSVVLAQRLAEAGHPVAAALFGVASLFAIIVCGEVFPKTMAVVFRSRLAARVSWPLAAAVRLFDPIAPFFLAITRFARRVFWPHVTREPYLEPDDLEQAVENTELSDDVAEQERQVLHNILDLSEIGVEEVMRPRGTYVALTPPVSLSDLTERGLMSDYFVIRAGGSEEIDRAIATSNLSFLPEEHLETIAEEVVHVPWCANLAYTLGLLREQFCSVASVVNEYGETVGIVTYEDIIDTILEPQPSRAKRLLRREPVLEIAAGKYHVEGITTLRYLCMRLEIDYEPASDGSVTVAGMLHDQLERMPVVGDECTWKGYLVRVIDVSKRGQLRAMLSRIGGRPRHSTMAQPF